MTSFGEKGGRRILAVLLALALGAVAAAVFVARSDDEGAARSASRLDDGALGTPTHVRLAGLPETHALDDPTPHVEVVDVELNEELPRTPSDPGASFFESAMSPATTLRESDTLLRQTVVDRGHAVLIAEPHVAANGQRVLLTWNKPTDEDGSAVARPGGGAAFSNDGGRTFTLVDPETERWGEVHAGYCCDQRALYSPKHDLWVWILQYFADREGNVLRIAVARGDKGFDDRVFTFYDLSPTALGIPPQSAAKWFDYPNVGASQDHLFLSANVYPFTGRLSATVVVRIPFADLAAGRPPIDVLKFFRFPPDASTPGDGENLTAVFTEGAETTMYFGQHVSDSTLRVWSWRDDESGARYVDVPHARYRHTLSPGYSCLLREGTSRGDWCQRSDDRLSSGWVADDTIGFAWPARQDPEHGFRYPFAMVVRVDERTMRLRDEPSIWSPDHAYQYATLAPNGRGDVGGVILAGGGERFLTCATLRWREGSDGSSGFWEARVADASDSETARAETGDYLGAVVAAPGANEWVASCLTLHGGGRDEHVEVRFLVFG